MSRHGWVGLALIAICWPLDWALPGLRTHLLFFPLWLGAVLLLDALVLRSRGRSLATDSPLRFAGLFVVSVPLWWLFEALNLRTGNWEYLGREHFSDLQYALLGSLSFSVVVPAVFEATDLVLGARWIGRCAHGPRVPGGPAMRLGLVVVGIAMMLALLAWPQRFYPLMWVGIVLMADPLAQWLGRRPLLPELARGDWRRFLALWVGALLCGVLWEAWNWLSWPKWIYHVPGAEFLYVFEMPLLGYLGYLPFGLEVWLLVHLLWPGAPSPEPAG